MKSRFDEQLFELNREIIEMGAMCEEAISGATQALINNDTSLAKKILEESIKIDQMEREIEAHCMKLLLHQQPVARDLRLISSALKMITDMERIGDQTADIAEIIQTGKAFAKDQMEEIDKMAANVRKMVRQSVKAYVEKDLELARKVQVADQMVDESFDKVRDQLIAYIKEAQGHHSKEIFNLIMITKYLERIGDHATNIAEWVEFSITGVHKKIVMS